MSKSFNFDTQFSKGEKWEITILLKYFPIFIKSKVRAYDLFDVERFLKIELKSEDDYSIWNTNNFFIERFSNIKTGTLGGVFRAYKDNVDYICHYFPIDNCEFWFSISEFYNAVTKLESNYKLIKVKNKNYSTGGYIIPRSEIIKLCPSYREAYPFST